LFHKALDEGRAVVLLDGLDEVLNTTTRQFVAEQAGSFIRQWIPQGNRFALTSRIVGYREARLPGDLPHVTVLDFGQIEIQQFASQWCRAYEVWVTGGETPTALQRAAAEEQALYEDVRSNPSVERLAASPLLLTMLALLRRHVGKLPDRRIDLYASYVRTLIDNWQLNRSRGARQQMPERFDLHTAIDHLIELAFWLQQNKPSGTARRQELEYVLENICLRFEGRNPHDASAKERVQARQAAERFLQDMRHFAGLLVERGRDAFGFLHLTFQEYFAGRALARMEPGPRWAAIKSHLHHPRWREPILLCAGQLGILEGRRDQVSDLAPRILQANSPHEDTLCRDLFLTVALAADDVGFSTGLLDELVTRLTSLRNSPVFTIRDNALAGLAHLTRLGYSPALTILMESLHNPSLQLHVISTVKAVISNPACTPVRQVVLAKLEDERYGVRQAAVRALAGLVGSDAAVRQVVLAKLEDEQYDVRLTAVETLTSLVGSDDAITQNLLPWLGVTGESFILEDIIQKTQHLLATTYAPLFTRYPALLSQAVQMLTSPAWPTRQGAARALIAMPGELPPHVRSMLVSLLDNSYSEESWPERLQVCEIFINASDKDLSQRAINLALAALDYGTQPWYCFLFTGTEVRRSAARILGQLEPLYRNDNTFARLARVLTEDADVSVRDAAYGALLRLAAAPENLSQG
jgi:HEAT repeat protein